MVTAKITQTGVAVVEGDSTKLSRFSLEVDQTGGTGATWIINLEGSLDGLLNYTPILTHTNLNPGDGQIESIGAGSFPCKFRRINVIALSLGTNTSLTAKFEGMA